MKRQSNLFLLFALVLVLALSCATGTKQTAKQMDYQFMAGYNAQAADYMRQAARTDLTESQKEMLRQKRKVLVEVYPLIKTYDSYVQTGQTPDAMIQQQILDLMNRLESMVVK